jgi:hypothetical protein
MVIIRVLLVLAYPIFVIPFYLDWSRDQAESQIDKMQAAVFNSPGMEAPVPPPVLGVGALLMVGYWLLTRLCGVRGWARALALLLSAPVGVAIYTQRQAGQG